MSITVTIGTGPTARRVSVTSAGQFAVAAMAAGVPMRPHTAADAVRQRDELEARRNAAEVARCAS